MNTAITMTDIVIDSAYKGRPVFADTSAIFPNYEFDGFHPLSVTLALCPHSLMDKKEQDVITALKATGCLETEGHNVLVGNFLNGDIITPVRKSKSKRFPFSGNDRPPTGLICIPDVRREYGNAKKQLSDLLNDSDEEHRSLSSFWMRAWNHTNRVENAMLSVPPPRSTKLIDLLTVFTIKLGARIGLPNNDRRHTDEKTIAWTVAYCLEHYEDSVLISADKRQIRMAHAVQSYIRDRPEKAYRKIAKTMNRVQAHTYSRVKNNLFVQRDPNDRKYPQTRGLLKDMDKITAEWTRLIEERNRTREEQEYRSA